MSEEEIPRDLEVTLKAVNAEGMPVAMRFRPTDMSDLAYKVTDFCRIATHKNPKLLNPNTK